MKSLKLFRSVVFLICISSMVVSCFKTKTTIPQRSSKVPETAFWSGGIDGGYWYEIKTISNDTYYIVIFNEVTGEIEKEGNFKVVVKSYTMDELKNKIDSFDGNRIILSEYVTLKAANK